jgi:hypothetical protein
VVVKLVWNPVSELELRADVWVWTVVVCHWSLLPLPLPPDPPAAVGLVEVEQVFVLWAKA